MKDKNVSAQKTGGIPVNIFAFPLLIVVAALHLIIIFLIADVNRSSSRLSDLMKQSGSYQLDATSLQGNNTVLSETSGTFVQLAGSAPAEVIADPLVTYARELGSNDRGARVLARFRGYNVSKDVLAYVERAAALSDRMVEVQLHAISLVDSVNPLPASIPEFSSLPLIELTPEEQNMSPEERLGLAKSMMIEKDYVQTRYWIAENISNCNRTLQQEFDAAAEKAGRHVSSVRLFLWISIFTIILFLSATFVIFYRLIVLPIKKYSKEIGESRRIEPIRDITELRRLVDAHNRQWDRRTELESFLRAAAETDPLTGLQNRNCLERDFMENEDYRGPLGVLLLDVNYLKHTNDSKGHHAGDQMLLTTVTCIRECFANGAEGNCYRIGGDEFLVFLKGRREDEIRRMIDRFHSVLAREGISVSVGCAYEEQADSSRFRPMMEIADRQMYEQKRKIHEKDKA